MKKTNENKGITLIALIITIIVMLILVGVTVNVALNGGLFDTAKTAAQKTNEAAQTEKEFSAYVALTARTDELVERYPLGLTMEISGGGKKPKFTNTNIVDFYEEILTEYGTSYSELSLAQGIRAANTFYEIAQNAKLDAATLQNTEALRYIQNDFWEDFGDITAFLGIEGGDSTKLNTLQLAFMFSKYNPSTHVAGFGGNGSDRCVILPNADELKTENTSMWAIAEILDYCFPGGALPVEEITGTTETSIDSNLSNLLNEADITKCKFLEVTSSNVNKIQIFGDDTAQAQDIIGKTIFVVPAEDTSEYDYYGCLLQNTLVINTVTGNIAYIDDNCVANKPIY